jgi:hypothetical protein
MRAYKGLLFEDKIKSTMKTACYFIIMFASFPAMAQRDSLPYAKIPHAPDHYSGGAVVSRLLDGLGFRYYWATEGLRPSDLGFRPSEKARSGRETLAHIYEMSIIIANVAEGKPNLPGQDKNLPFEEMRKATLENLKRASTILAGYSDRDMENLKVVFQDKKQTYQFPFWNLINGPMSDCLWHVGQLVSFRRSSGNPFSDKVDVFLGTITN